MSATVGGLVVVCVPATANEGHDHAPALVTGVSEDGKNVDLVVFYRDGHITAFYGAELVDDREAAMQLLAEHADQHLTKDPKRPGRYHGDDDDGESYPARWVSVAYPVSPVSSSTSKGASKAKTDS